MTGSMTAIIRPLQTTDRAAWRVLWTDYLDFYKSSVETIVYDTTFQRLIGDDAHDYHCLIAEVAGKPVGLAHYLFHRHCWRVENVCYLQDLYVDTAMRGHGIGRQLIAAVYAAADMYDAPGVYWLTQDDNKSARMLYDRVGQVTDFIKYQRIA